MAYPLTFQNFQNIFVDYEKKIQEFFFQHLFSFDEIYTHLFKEISKNIFFIHTHCYNSSFFCNFPEATTLTHLNYLVPWLP